MIIAMFFRRQIFVVSTFFLIVALFPFFLSAYDFVDWSRGASGHEYTIRDVMDQEKPVVVNFHVSWCKWCRVMNDQYLASSEIDRFIQGIPRMEINPDNDSEVI